jgi:hypothetical protein
MDTPVTSAVQPQIFSIEEKYRQLFETGKYSQHLLDASKRAEYRKLEDDRFKEEVKKAVDVPEEEQEEVKTSSRPKYKIIRPKAKGDDVSAQANDIFKAVANSKKNVDKTPNAKAPGKGQGPPRYRAFILTINNPEDEDYEPFEDTRLKYFIYQHEIGEECKTPHIQAFIYYYDPISEKSCRKRWPRAHVEYAHDITACIKYCSKLESRDPAPDSGPFEWGIKPEQGRRTDLEALALDIKEGKKTPSELMDEFPVLFIKYPKGIQTLIDARYKPRTCAPFIVWLWGISGTGKSHYARCRHSLPDKLNIADPEKLYQKDGTKWWDKYHQQEAILIDDFDPTKWPLRDFLTFLDNGAYQGQTKFGYIYINSPKIYITCEFSPRDAYNKVDGEDNNLFNQVWRRLDRIIEKTEVYKGENRKVQVEVKDEY